jgi:hypothetical protein
MTAKTPTTDQTNPTDRPTDLMPMHKALALLGDIKPSTFSVAANRHDYLKNSIVREIHPDTGKEWTQISKAAVEKYAAERRPGHTSNGHEGFKHAIYLTEDEVKQAEQVLSETLGREIVITRMFKTKKTETDDNTEK